MGEIIGLIIAFVLVAIIIVMQIVSFSKTRKKINELKGIFSGVDFLSTKETYITSKDLSSKLSLDLYLNRIPNIEDKGLREGEDEDTDYTDLSLLKTPAMASNRFRSIITRTNEYLCKNAGASAELGILEDICDKQIESLDDEIQGSLNVPLYLGLAGTFIGIITGLWGVNFEHIFANAPSGVPNINLDGLQHLLYGIIAAMSASLLGLAFTVYNSAFEYKSASSKSSKGKEDYMSFLRSELMPLLANSMTASLNSLRGVLAHFVDRFGRNLSAYADSAELLNDNLEKQHLVLQEINRLSLTEMSSQIASTFQELKESSDHLKTFKTYQKGLNDTIEKVGNVTSQIQSIISNFEEFSVGLATVVSNQNTANELQQQFKSAIETHFPTGSEARDIWRNEFDLVVSEGQKVSEDLSEQLAASTTHIKNFVENNNEFIDTFKNMREVLATLTQYTNVQRECYSELKTEIANLRNDYKDAQQESLELHKATVKAVEAMTKALKEKDK